MCVYMCLVISYNVFTNSIKNWIAKRSTFLNELTRHLLFNKLIFRQNKIRSC